MKAIIEMPISEINVVTATAILSVINDNSALTDVLIWVSGVDTRGMSNIDCLFNYIIPRTNNVVSFSYIFNGQIENLAELTLFASVGCKEHFVNKENITVDKLADNIARLLLLYIPADKYYFYKDFPKYHDHKIEFLSSYQDNQDVTIYGPDEDLTNFNDYISHTVITDKKRDSFAKIINKRPDMFINNSGELRRQIIQCNINMMTNIKQTNVPNIVCDISKDLYNILVSKVNFQ